MPKKGLLGGAKIAKNHSTIIPDAVKLIEYAKTLSEVKMIVPSEIAALKPAPKHIKFSAILAGWKIAIRGTNARQIVFIYTSSPAEVKEVLEKYWLKK